MNGKDPAFPGLEKFEMFDDEKARYVEVYKPSGGLTKREEFAKAAMQGLCANYSYDGAISFNAVEIADALIAALSKTEKS